MFEQSLPAGRLTQLDGLRGVAALMVVFSHVTTLFRPQMYFGTEGGGATAQTWFAESPLFVTINGSFAVYIFFVLSGFVIAASADQHHGSLLSTVVARVARLSLPCAASLAFAGLIISLRPTSLAEASNIVGHWRIAQAPATFDNPAPWSDVLSDAFGRYYWTGLSYINGVLWTMQRELLGSVGIYVVFFFAQAVVFRLAIFAVAGGVLLLANLESHYYLCFVAGAWLFLLRAQIALLPSWVGFIGIAAGLLFGGKPFFTPAPDTLYDVPYRLIASLHGEMYIWPTGAAMLVLGLLVSSGMARLLSRIFMRFLGRVSFAVYLVHFPLIIFVLPLLFIAFGQFSEVRFAVAVALYVALVYATGFVFTVFVDEPSVRFSRAIKRHSWLSKSLTVQSSMKKASGTS
jgi:peptidoglycan/LPS O-acetylase OafA/YrhL